MKPLYFFIASIASVHGLSINQKPIPHLFELSFQPQIGDTCIDSQKGLIQTGIQDSIASFAPSASASLGGSSVEAVELLGATDEQSRELAQKVYDALSLFNGDKDDPGFQWGCPVVSSFCNGRPRGTKAITRPALNSKGANDVPMTNNFDMCVGWENSIKGNGALPSESALWPGFCKAYPKGSDMAETVAARVVLHEFFHSDYIYQAAGITARDMPDRRRLRLAMGDFAYGKKGILNLQNEQKMANADSFFWFAFYTVRKEKCGRGFRRGSHCIIALQSAEFNSTQNTMEDPQCKCPDGMVKDIIEVDDSDGSKWDEVTCVSETTIQEEL
ncbi:MAG: hypothetical protein M1834_008883 [Cirrosporium novae-zelandiae]|nr:MAG: hypothetical protein M1834_008883 [Cirrosporium novae-zelandiae]